jgi:hypothetical protein
VFFKLLIICLVLTAVAVAGLGIRMLLIKDSSFPDTHVGHNPEMRKRGISCAQNEDMGCLPGNDDICCSCSTGKDPDTIVH